MLFFAATICNELLDVVVFKSMMLTDLQMFISIQLYLSLLLSYLLELCIVYEDCTSHTCKNKAQTKSYCCLILVSCVHNMKGSHYTVIIIV